MRAATRSRPTPPMPACSRPWSDPRPSREGGSGTRASRPAVHWAACDVCCSSPRSPRSPAASGWRSTGSVRSPPRGTGTPRTRAVCRSCATGSPPRGICAGLGTHGVGGTNDPFSRGIVIDDWGSAPVTVLRDEVAVVESGGHEIEIAGVDPALFALGRHRPPELLFARPGAFRILLSHFPDVPAQMPPGTCALALCGHLHGGQICLPTPRGKVRLSHRSYRYDEGVYEDPETTVVVSRGLGTTLVPFRLMARPEVCLLRLRRR